MINYLVSDECCSNSSWQKWIIETKGGWSRITGESEDIDDFSPKKFKYLKKYLADNNLQGGFVRCYEGELLICQDHYSDDFASSDWKLLSEVIQ